MRQLLKCPFDGSTLENELHLNFLCHNFSERSASECSFCAIIILQDNKKYICGKSSFHISCPVIRSYNSDIRKQLNIFYILLSMWDSFTNHKMKLIVTIYFLSYFICLFRNSIKDYEEGTLSQIFCYEDNNSRHNILILSNKTCVWSDLTSCFHIPSEEGRWSNLS